jgi:hypothetical protein
MKPMSVLVAVVEEGLRIEVVGIATDATNTSAHLNALEEKPK